MVRRKTRGIRPRWITLAQGLICAVGVSGMAGLGCSSDAEEAGDGTGTAGDCLTDREYFAKKVWAPVLGSKCLSCHGPGGVAEEAGADFSLLPPSYPGFLDENLKAVTTIAKTKFEGKSTLVRKPLGQMKHGGGEVIAPGSAEYKALEGLVSKLNSSETCKPKSSAASFKEVVLMDALATTRKASLNLVGRLPTAKEIQRVLDEGEGSLRPLLDTMMTEEAFFSRVKEIYNDMLLVNRYLGYSSYALNLLSTDQYPNSGEAWFDNLPSSQKPLVNKAIAHEPLELIAHIVRNDKPFTEVLTANYTVMNPYSAKVFNAKVTFNNPDDPNEWKEGQIIALGDTSKGQPAEMVLPHAGVLTSPIFLNRFPTSETNVNRHRSRMVMQFFLATDILKVGERPIDPTAATALANPTREDPNCSVCHKMMDPIAGAFQKFRYNDQEEYDPKLNWHEEMFPPGFGQEKMQLSDYDQAPQWLAQRIIKDPRFTISVVYTVYTALTGKQPLDYPAFDDGEFDNKLVAWEAQDNLFRKIGEAFVADNYNFKTVVREMVLSPYFRAKNLSGEVSAARASQLQYVGTGRFSTPESLSRKIKAVTGLNWGENDVSKTGYYGDGGKKYLMSDYQVLYGGIDSDEVTKRLSSPNGVMANISWRMANEMACSSTAWDLSRKKPSERFLFPYVEVTDTPSTGGDAIKKNIRYLHAHILGEALDEGSPELDKTYQLFVDTLKEGQAKLKSKGVEESIVYNCRARKNPFTNQTLPDSEKLEKDPDYTVRAWMAVITYLLADYRFLYEE